jgi:GAF domain-containing protein
LVIPFYDAQGSLIGVFDIDSDQPAAFDQNDADQLQSLMSAVFSQA